jgi:hypothetical protein
MSLVIGAIYICKFLAPSILNRCSMWMFITHVMFIITHVINFPWDWKADKLSVAEINWMELKNLFTPMPMDLQNWPK